MVFPGAIWVHFDQPAWLLAGLAALIPAALAIRNHRRTGGIRRWCIALQSFALLLAAISLARPVVPSLMRPPRWLILRDVSASTGRQVDAALKLPADVTFERHSFAGTMLSRHERNNLDATHLRGVLEWSAAAIRTGRADGAILLTDGQFQDDWLSAARDYARTRAPLWIVPLDAPPADARIETVTVRRRPSRASLRSVATYDISISLGANAPMRRTVALFRLTPDGAKRRLSESEIVLESNRPATIHMRDSLPFAAAGVWEAELAPHDLLSRNDTFQAARLPVRSRIAWVAAGRSATTIPGVDAVSLSPADAPVNLTGWLGYGAVVLADATGTLLSPPQRKSLAEYVRGGGGLVLLGAGPHEAPDDRNDPLNRVLPLRADPFERNPLNLTVVLDASGSMAQAFGSPAQPKWSLAREAVLSLREHLTHADRLRVIVFSDDARTIYDSKQAAPDFSALAEALRNVRPNGPTDIAPALQQILEAPPEGDKTNLVIVLSDLQTAKFDPIAVAKKFRKQRRSLAVVATGCRDGEKTPLAQLAEELHAPLIHREHLQGLADVFGKLCRLARGDSILDGWHYIPEYDASWPKAARVLWFDAVILAAKTSNAHVYARIEDKGEPILAAGSAGLGRASVVSAPPEAILSKPGCGKLLAELIRRTARPGDDPRFDVQTTREANRLHIRATVRQDEKAVNDLKLEAEALALTKPLREAEFASCNQTAPGVYEAEIPVSADHDQTMAVGVLEKSGFLRWQGVVPASYPAEFARIGAEYEQLRTLAGITDGKIVRLADVSSPAMRRELRRPRRTGRAIWRITLAGAITTMLLAWIGGTLRRKTKANS